MSQPGGTSQPGGDSAVPRPKVAAAGIAGAATTILIFILERLGVEVPADVAAAITALLAFVAGYFTPQSGA
jgi:hypothetical protein